MTTQPAHEAHPAAHEAHDRLAVAAFAAGDATGAELDLAAALVAACPACAELHRDLRAITAGLAATTDPATLAAVAPRPRDFRITAAQAARLRPAGWRRLLVPLAGPRFAFAAPLGTGLAAAGLAGILVAGAAGLPLGAGGSAAAPMQPERATTPMASAAAPGAPGGDDQVTGQTVAGPDTLGPVANGGATGGGATDAGGGIAAPPPAPDATGDPFSTTAKSSDGTEVHPDASGSPELSMPDPAPAPTAPVPWLQLAALGAILAGALVGGLRLAARRVAG